MFEKGYSEAAHTYLVKPPLPWGWTIWDSMWRSTALYRVEIRSNELTVFVQTPGEWVDAGAIHSLLPGVRITNKVGGQLIQHQITIGPIETFVGPHWVMCKHPPEEFAAIFVRALEKRAVEIR